MPAHRILLKNRKGVVWSVQSDQGILGLLTEKTAHADLGLAVRICIRAIFLHCVSVADSVDPDQTLRSAASDQGLHCLVRLICRGGWMRQKCCVSCVTGASI